MLEKIGYGIVIALLFFFLALLALGGSLIAERWIGDLRIATTLSNSSIALGVLGIVIAVLIVFSGTVTRNAEAISQRSPDQTIIVVKDKEGDNQRNIEQIPLNPYQNNHELSNQRQYVLNESQLKELIEIVRKSQRYLPSESKERKDKEIELW